MSAETQEWIDRNFLAGFTDESHGRGRPWWAHNGSTNLYPDAIPVDEVVRRLFAWEALELPATYEFNGQTMTVSGQKLIVASDNGDVLGLHSTKYPVFQYADWMLTNVAGMLDAGLHIGSAGLLKGRKIAWVSVEMRETMDVAGTEISFRPRLLTVTSHDGSLAFKMKGVNTITVCDNTMAMALAEVSPEYVQRHRGEGKFNAEAARSALNIIHQNTDAFADAIKGLTETTVTDRQWAAFLDAAIPVPNEEGAGKTRAENKREVISEMYRTDARCERWAGTAWGVLQTINTFENWNAQLNKKAGEKAPNRLEANMLKAITSGPTSFEERDGKALKTLQKVLATV